jgi:hypothetical protein
MLWNLKIFLYRHTHTHPHPLAQSWPFSLELHKKPEGLGSRRMFKTVYNGWITHHAHVRILFIQSSSDSTYLCKARSSGLVNIITMTTNICWRCMVATMMTNAADFSPHYHDRHFGAKWNKLDAKLQQLKVAMNDAFKCQIISYDFQWNSPL